MSDEGPRLPRLRRRPLPAEATVVVVRGDDLGEGSDRRQAEAFRRRWPDWQRFGLSAYFAEDDDAIADLAADQLERFPVLRIYRAGELVAAGVGSSRPSVARTSPWPSQTSTPASLRCKPSSTRSGTTRTMTPEREAHGTPRPGR